MYGLYHAKEWQYTMLFNEMLNVRIVEWKFTMHKCSQYMAFIDFRKQSYETWFSLYINLLFSGDILKGWLVPWYGQTHLTLLWLSYVEVMTIIFSLKDMWHLATKHIIIVWNFNSGYTLWLKMSCSDRWWGVIYNN